VLDVKPDVATEAELIDVPDHFCAGFPDRDAEAVIRLCAPDPDLVVVTSEEPLLRGPLELRRFLDRYVEGPTTYSWQWERHDVSIAGAVAWLVAEGTETAASGRRVERHLYRMTMVLERRGDRWPLTQVHGSSPQRSLLLSVQRSSATQQAPRLGVLLIDETGNPGFALSTPSRRASCELS
jgi:hypothetical protein